LSGTPQGDPEPDAAGGRVRSAGWTRPRGRRLRLYGTSPPPGHQAWGAPPTAYTRKQVTSTPRQDQGHSQPPTLTPPQYPQGDSTARTTLTWADVSYQQAGQLWSAAGVSRQQARPITGQQQGQYGQQHRPSTVSKGARGSTYGQAKLWPGQPGGVQGKFPRRLWGSSGPTRREIQKKSVALIHRGGFGGARARHHPPRRLCARFLEGPVLRHHPSSTLGAAPGRVWSRSRAGKRDPLRRGANKGEPGAKKSRDSHVAQHGSSARREEGLTTSTGGQHRRAHQASGHRDVPGRHKAAQYEGRAGAVSTSPVRGKSPRRAPSVGVRIRDRDPARHAPQSPGTRRPCGDRAAVQREGVRFHSNRA